MQIRHRTSETMDITFKRMTEADLPQLHRWVNTPALVEIWNHGTTVTFEAVAAKQLPRIRGEQPTDPYFIYIDGQPGGFIQAYRWRDYAEYFELLNLGDEAAAGLDVFLADEWRGAGIGPVMLRQFMSEIIFGRWPEIVSCVITPDAANERAIRAYEKAGFVRVAVVNHPDEPTPVIILRAPKAQP